MSFVATPVRQPDALGILVVNQLRRSIITGELAPGQRLIEAKLSNSFDVSRGPIRDALKALESENLIETRRNGAWVVGLSSRDIDELYGLRALVELEALRISSLSGESEWQRPKMALERMRAGAEAGDPEAMGSADLEFHSSFYQVAGQRRLWSVWNQYRPTFAVLLSLSNAEGRDDMTATVHDHETLLESVISRDLDLVAERFRAHNDESLRRMQGFHRRIEQKDPQVLRLISKEK